MAEQGAAPDNGAVSGAPGGAAPYVIGRARLASGHPG
jgi:hypothetical protein